MTASPRHKPTLAGAGPQRPEGLSANNPADAPPAGDTRAVLRHLRELVRALDEHSRWVETRCGLSALQLGALQALARTPGMKVSELAAALLIHQSTASNMLDKLEAKGLLHRTRVGPDQRVVRLHLTAAGADLLGTAPHPEEGGLNGALRRLPPDALARLTADLGAVVASLQETKDGTGSPAARRRQEEPTDEGTK